MKLITIALSILLFSSAAFSNDCLPDKSRYTKEIEIFDEFLGPFVGVKDLKVGKCVVNVTEEIRCTDSKFDMKLYDIEIITPIVNPFNYSEYTFGDPYPYDHSAYISQVGFGEHDARPEYTWEVYDFYADKEITHISPEMLYYKDSMQTGEYKWKYKNIIIKKSGPDKIAKIAIEIYQKDDDSLLDLLGRKSKKFYYICK